MKEQPEIQARQVEATAKYAEMAGFCYENGSTGYIEVLDAERNLFSAQLNYVQTKGSLLFSLVNVCKSMGGRVMDLDRKTPF